MSDVLVLRNVIKEFWQESGKAKRVLSDISFSLADKEVLCIMGGSGCGKTTLLRIIGLLEYLTRGEIEFSGKSINALSDEQRSAIRRNEIGFVFQDYKLMNALSVKDNILLPLVLEHVEAGVAEKRTVELAEYFGIQDIMKQYPCTLSGGQKQRVAICRALANNPKLILADEPTGNLDMCFRKKTIQILLDMRNKYGKSIIIVTHDPYVASFCDRVLLMGNGEMKEIIHDDKEPFKKKIIVEYKKYIKNNSVK